MNIRGTKVRLFPVRKKCFLHLFDNRMSYICEIIKEELYVREF